jgi:hypothetical protein
MVKLPQLTNHGTMKKDFGIKIVAISNCSDFVCGFVISQRAVVQL